MTDISEENTMTIQPDERPDCFFNRQQHTELEAGGRFSKVTQTTLTGATDATPRLPENSPWAGDDPVPPEPPLGFSIDALEPVGTPQEVAKSLNRKSEE
jgi:hypothetical protein